MSLCSTICTSLRNQSLKYCRRKGANPSLLTSCVVGACVSHSTTVYWYVNCSHSEYGQLEIDSQKQMTLLVLTLDKYIFTTIYHDNGYAPCLWVCVCTLCVSVWLAQLVKSLAAPTHVQLFTHVCRRSGFNPRSRQSRLRIPALRGVGKTSSNRYVVGDRYRRLRM